MPNTNYAFEDVSVTIAHPAFGQYVANGAGLGNINTTMAGDRTAHDISADGSVMASKIKNRSGTHTFAIQQASDLHRWLIKLFNFMETSPASEWNRISIVIRSPLMQDMTTSTGVSFQKIPDRPYQAQGQQITWTFMAADIQQNVA